jgi:hypothetical protein
MDIVSDYNVKWFKKTLPKYKFLFGHWKHKVKGGTSIKAGTYYE